jgi:hypothetical protein
MAYERRCSAGLQPSIRKETDMHSPLAPGPYHLSPITYRLPPIHCLLRRAHMPTVALTLATAARAFWWWLRQVLGDAAYDNYLRSATKPSFRAQRGIPLPPTNVRGASCCGHAAEGGRPCGERSRTILTREEFYLDSLRRRYSSVSRCC